jgi:hypothetical protein
VTTGKGYISQLPVATGLAGTDVTIVDQQTASGPVTRQAALALVYPDSLTINPQTGAAYTLALTDAQHSWLEMNSSSAQTVTVPANATVPFPIGALVPVQRFGAGSVTVQGASGVTVNSSTILTLRAQFSAALLIQNSLNVWSLVGDTT